MNAQVQDAGEDTNNSLVGDEHCGDGALHLCLVKNIFHAMFSKKEQTFTGFNQLFVTLDPGLEHFESAIFNICLVS